MPPSSQPPLRLRDRVRRALYAPPVEVSLVVLILLSVVLLVVELAWRPGSVVRLRLEQTSDVLTSFFVVELALRYWVEPRKGRFFRRYWADILAVLPIFRPLRFLRVLRLLRLFRAGLLLNRRMNLFGGALRDTLQELTVIGTVTLAMVLAAVFVLHLAEGGPGRPFPTIGDTLWFAIYSMVAGEPTGGQPQTIVGKLATLALMFGGLSTFGMFIGTISASMVSRISGNLEVTIMDLDDLEGHTLVCGWSHAGPTVLDELFAGRRGAPGPVVLVTEQSELTPPIPSAGLRRDLLYRVVGDYTRVEVLEQAGAARANSAIIMTDTTMHRSEQDRDARTVLAALSIEQIAPQIFTVAELNNRDNATLLERSGVEEIVVADEYNAVIMGSASRNRGLVSVLDEILSNRYGNAFHKSVVPAALAGLTVLEVHDRLKRDYGAVLVSVEQDQGGHYGTLVNPAPDLVIGEQDLLVVISEGPLKLR